MSGHGTRGNEIVKRESIEGTESTPRTLYGLIDHLGRKIYGIWIIAGSPSVLDVVSPLELLKALGASIVNVLGVGNKLRRRRRSVGSRHFVMEDWLMVQGATANAVVVSS